MELVSIESEEEQDELNKILVDSGNSFDGGPLNQKLINDLVDSDVRYWWTSGSDRGVEDEWIWTATGGRFNYTNWGTQTHRTGHNQDYMQLERRVGFSRRRSGIFFWNDFPRSDREFAICEY